MVDRPSNRQRRQHLKNLRKVRKSRMVERIAPRDAAARTSSGNPLVTFGLVITSAVLLLFLGSAYYQFKSSQNRDEEKAAAAAVPLVEPSTVEVRVLNGCGAPGAGRSMTEHLRSLHFDVVASDNAENFTYENTLVINHTSRPEIGQSVAAALGCSHLSVQSDDLALAHVTVILGRDWENFIKAPADSEDKETFANYLAGKLVRAKRFIGLK
ncbi:MAG: hypothetical protein A2Z86_02120 [Candidatus Glassbacteria bacterium GWA2_58_10]|uniref:LytR/CpsA/Psr regulator C-terminal domain-containing protein n=1 Tax=Candidatus Glassbacteria bacterium GWA2_58_10 TaxID=1817865 RepID=A0A1F5YG07_9BACT|nr:MAG: hypothetical protein A2Z86_02120 [Candidatus Glassbacteria bacterium GWA2_58_10]